MLLNKNAVLNGKSLYILLYGGCSPGKYGYRGGFFKFN